MRLVPAAKQLAREITDVEDKAKVEVVGDPDGLGFSRSIRVGGAPGKRLKVALDVIGDDPRVAEVVHSSAGTRVTFVNTTRADFAHSFDLGLAVAALDEE